jgi:CMP-2-keto-3-deoxyoctulosonic acid synthetase
MHAVSGAGVWGVNIMGDIDVRRGDSSGADAPADAALNASPAATGSAGFEEKPISSIDGDLLGNSNNPNTSDTTLEQRTLGTDDILHMIFRHVEQVHREVIALGKKLEKTNARIHNLKKIIESKK